jgi:lysophospholipase L1-like esterase
VATAPSVTYRVAAGASVNAGRFAGGRFAGAMALDSAAFSGNVAGSDPPPAIAALMGDSLTDKAYDYTPWYWQNAAAGGVLKTIHNAGRSGDTVAGMLARVNNSYTNALPGLAGLPPLGFIGLRAGTNGVGPAAISTTVQGQYVSLIAALKTYLAPNGKIVIFALPPIGAPYTSYNIGVASYNAYLQGLAAGDSALVWIDDCVNVRDGSGNPIAGMFIDTLHMSGAGTQQMGIDGGAALASLLSPYGYASPVVTDSADFYPATTQWNSNHVNAGSVAVTGAFTGSAPTGYAVGASGAGIAGTVSIVAADGGDSNTTPWLRIAPTQSQTGSSVSVSRTLAGRTITAGETLSCDTIMEVRFNAFDSRQWSSLQLYGRRPSAHAMTQVLKLGVGGDVALTRTATFRHALPFVVASTETAMQMQLLLVGAANTTGSMGSIDFRCITLRG